jgi:hypothetical protein
VNAAVAPNCPQRHLRQSKIAGTVAEIAPYLVRKRRLLLLVGISRHAQWLAHGLFQSGIGDAFEAQHAIAVLQFGVERLKRPAKVEVVDPNRQHDTKAAWAAPRCEIEEQVNEGGSVRFGRLGEEFVELVDNEQRLGRRRRPIAAQCIGGFIGVVEGEAPPQARPRVG